MLIGGGEKDALAMARFVAWARGEQSRLLYVMWATSVPEESAAQFRKDVAPHKPGSVEVAPLAPLTPEQRQAAREQIERATGIFFYAAAVVRAARRKSSRSALTRSFSTVHMPCDEPA